MSPKDFKKFIVWVDYENDGWNPIDSFDNFDDAANQLLESLSGGNRNAVVTEYIPVKIVPASVVKIEQPVYRE